MELAQKFPYLAFGNLKTKKSSSVYQLLPNQITNHGAVWKHIDSREDLYIFYANNNEWMIGDQEDMLTGEASGFWCANGDNALTPNYITSTWLKSDDEIDGWRTCEDIGIWTITPSQFASAKAKVKSDQKLQQELLDIHMNSPPLRFSNGGKPCAKSNRFGVYRPFNEFINRSPVWKHEAQPYFLYRKQGYWFISQENNMRLNNLKGAWRVKTKKSNPTKITKTWHVLTVNTPFSTKLKWHPILDASIYTEPHDVIDLTDDSHTNSTQNNITNPVKVEKDVAVAASALQNLASATVKCFENAPDDLSDDFLHISEQDCSDRVEQHDSPLPPVAPPKIIDLKKLHHTQFESLKNNVLSAIEEHLNMAYQFGVTHANSMRDH